MISQFTAWCTLQVCDNTASWDFKCSKYILLVLFQDIASSVSHLLPMLFCVHPKWGIPPYNCTFSLSPNPPLHEAKLTHQGSVPHSPLQHSNKKRLGISHLVFLYRFLCGIYQGLEKIFICLPSGHSWWLLPLCRGSSCQHCAAGM